MFRAPHNGKTLVIKNPLASYDLPGTALTPAQQQHHEQRSPTAGHPIAHAAHAKQGRAKNRNAVRQAMASLYPNWKKRSRAHDHRSDIRSIAPNAATTPPAQLPETYTAHEVLPPRRDLAQYPPQAPIAATATSANNHPVPTQVSKTAAAAAPHAPRQLDSKQYHCREMRAYVDS